MQAISPNFKTQFLLFPSSMRKTHHYSHAVSRFFPSPFGSCRHGTDISNIIENSIIPITKPIPTIKPISSSLPIHPLIKNKPQKCKCSAIYKAGKIESGLKGRKCPHAPVTHISPSESGSNRKHDVSTRFAVTKNSSSSNRGWFSSEGEEKEVEADIDADSEEFFSFSSDSSCPLEVFPISVDDRSSVRRIGVKFEPNCRREIGSCIRRSRRRRGRSRGSGKGSCKIEESAIAASIGRTKSRQKFGETKREAGKCSRGSVVRETEHTEILAISSNTGSGHRKTGKIRPIRRGTGEHFQIYQLMGRCPIVMGGGRVEQSYAVEKTSSNAYSDFRESMVDMILEKDIYGDEELEKLLQCFLSLNSSQHHRVILEVFAEISEAFSNE